MKQYYKAILGEKNTLYYQTKFEGFDSKGDAMTVSWNWSAFFIAPTWALYRKMYGWFFILAIILFLSDLLGKIGENNWAFIVWFIPWITFTLFSNALYHKSLRKKIMKAKSNISDEKKLIRYLKYKGGVNEWVALYFWGTFIIGILAVVLISIYAGN